MLSCGRFYMWYNFRTRYYNIRTIFAFYTPTFMYMLLQRLTSDEEALYRLIASSSSIIVRHYTILFLLDSLSRMTEHSLIDRLYGTNNLPFSSPTASTCTCIQEQEHFHSWNAHHLFTPPMYNSSSPLRIPSTICSNSQTRYDFARSTIYATLTWEL